MKNLMYAVMATALIASFSGCRCPGSCGLFTRPWGCSNGSCGGGCQSCGGSGCNSCGGTGICRTSDPNRYALGGPPAGAPWLSNQGVRRAGMWDTIEGGGCPTCRMLGRQHGCNNCNHCCSHFPRNTGLNGAGAGNEGPMTGQVAYPYYTTRGPRDFLAKNPASIGP